MARILNQQEYLQRRDEILDSAQRFVYSKGYEQMSIQDILDDLKISKGAFYHYFDSKSALLEGLTSRILAGVMLSVQPIVDDPNLNAVEKLHRYFDAGARWKTERKDYLLSLFRIWYTDNNAILRQRITASTLEVISPMITKIIEQGIAEGVFHTDFPDEMARVVMTLLQGMGDGIAMLILSPEPGEDAGERLVKIVQIYTDSIERVLGLQKGSLHLIAFEDLQGWIQTAELSKQ